MKIAAYLNVFSQLVLLEFVKILKEMIRQLLNKKVMMFIVALSIVVWGFQPLQQYVEHIALSVWTVVFIKAYLVVIEQDKRKGQ